MVFGAAVATGVAAMLFAHPSIGGMAMGVFALPTITLAVAVWLLVSAFLRWPIRRAGLLVVLVLGWGYFTLVRLDGVDGSINANLVYRWMPTPEDKFLAEAAQKKSAPPVANTATAERLELEPGDWPGFRGPDRDSHLTGVRLVANWDKQPPRQVALPGRPRLVVVRRRGKSAVHARTTGGKTKRSFATTPRPEASVGAPRSGSIYRDNGRPWSAATPHFMTETLRPGAQRVP